MTQPSSLTHSHWLTHTGSHSVHTLRCAAWRLTRQGWVCSDYDGTRSTIDAANGGLDIAMPGPPNRPDFFGTMLLEQLKKGTVKQSVVDEKATRIVYERTRTSTHEHAARETKRRL
jgi:hypothetical protein